MAVSPFRHKQDDRVSHVNRDIAAVPFHDTAASVTFAPAYDTWQSRDSAIRVAARTTKIQLLCGTSVYISAGMQLDVCET